MRQYFRQAIYNALAPLGETNRSIVIYHLQKDYGLRFAEGGNSPSIEEIEMALESVFGSAAMVFVARFEQELQKYLLPIKRSAA